MARLNRLNADIVTFVWKKRKLKSLYILLNCLVSLIKGEQNIQEKNGMKYRFTIPNDPKKNHLPHNVRMPSLNDFIHAERQRTPKGFTKGAVMKKEWQKYVVSCIRKQLRVRITKPICVHYYYYEHDRKRDIGNVHAFCQKVVEDAMQDCRLIPNDNQYYIPKFTADFYIDPINPRIEVVLEELDYGTKI